jgi:hypothetical protein
LPHVARISSHGKEVTNDSHRLGGTSMRIKIRGGTASNGEPSLCLTCRFATIVKGASLRDEIVECSQLSYGRNRVAFPVTQCTEYSDRRQPSLRAMEEIAWVLRSDPTKNEIGFVKRSELTRRERFVLDDDELLVSASGHRIPAE